MKNWITSRLKLIHKSFTMWTLAACLGLSQALPDITNSMPLAQQAFSSETYQVLMKTLFVAGIVLRFVHLRPDHDRDHDEDHDAH